MMLPSEVLDLENSVTMADHGTGEKILEEKGWISERVLGAADGRVRTERAHTRRFYAYTVPTNDTF